MSETHGPTIADIFREGFPQYCAAHGPFPKEHYKVANAIMNCRTADMGGHVYTCDECGHEHITYNSCRNRHCPQCQALARAAWVGKRMEELLPVPYFHVVFTVPSELNPFALRNKKAFYAILFRAVSETLLTLAQNKKYLGAAIGIISVLHNWGQAVLDHPHIHCVVPGGGIKNSTWKRCRSKFLFPVPVMQALFKGKFMDYFKQALADGSIQYHGTLAEYKDAVVLESLLDTLYRTKWVAYIKPPFANPEAVLKYLGSYTHRIAISNQRIVSVQDGKVSFTWKDYAHGNVRKIMTVSVPEFLRRFLLHVMPTGFVRIRHYGFFGNRTRKQSLNQCRESLGVSPVETKEPETPQTWVDIYKALTGNDPTLCPCCHKGHLKQTKLLGNSPP